MRFPVPMALAVSMACALTHVQAADVTAGRAKADAACAVCHGPNGVSMLPNAPHLAAQPAIYLVEQLKNYRSGKRGHEVMELLRQRALELDKRS